jgi:serine/threonine-protein kinase
MRVGRTLDLPKFEVIEELGHGGMATVFRARDRRLHREVALKVMHPHLRDSTEVARRFAVEAQVVAKLRHPNIVEVYDVSGDEEGERYLVVELVKGRNLRSLFREHGALPPEVAAAIGLEVLHALAHAHALGVVHRDVKPENVLIDCIGVEKKRAVIKLTDFGIAKVLDLHGATATGQVLGSPSHMAPEQIEGSDVGPRADIFALGVLLYEAMVGHLPFEGTNPAQVLRQVLECTYPKPDDEQPPIGRMWAAILERALRRDPDERFANCAEMEGAIATELGHLGVTEPTEELARFLADPPGYAREHKPRLISVLCEKAGDARRAGDVMRAAADYNRAIAYAPDDRELMRSLARLNASTNRSKLARRVSHAVVFFALCGVLSFATNRAIRTSWVGRASAQRVAVGVPTAKVTSEATAPTAPVPPVASWVETGLPAPVQPPEARPDANANVTPRLPQSAPAISAAVPIASAPAPALATVRRTIVLRSVQPVAGVSATLDGSPIGETLGGRAIALDGHSHRLVFSCLHDLCEPLARVIAEGDRAESFDVALRVKPAYLVVAGDASSAYDILENPQLHVVVGARIRYPMTGMHKTITVRQVSTGARRSVDLVAGKERGVSFGPE